MSSVHYKFKAALDYSTVTFNGINISVGELKEKIFEQEGVSTRTNFDLQIQNAQTKEVFEDELTLIARNTSVIVMRVPKVQVAEKRKSAGGIARGVEGCWSNNGDPFAAMQRNHLANLPPPELVNNVQGVDLVRMDLSEEEKFRAMMLQATADYHPSRFMKIRGSNQHGRVPDNYICHKCNSAGHWIKNCSKVSNDICSEKRRAGIPRVFY